MYNDFPKSGMNFNFSIGMRKSGRTPVSCISNSSAGDHFPLILDNKCIFWINWRRWIPEIRFRRTESMKELRDQLHLGNTRSNRDRIARWIATDEGRFEEVMKIYLKGDFRDAQLAAGVLFSCFEFHPGLISPWLASIVRRMGESGVHPAVRRVGVWILQKAEIPVSLQGRTINSCFRFLSDPSEPLAIRAFSMKVLSRLTYEHPDLARELRETIQSLVPYGNPAFKTHGRNVIRELDKRETRRKPSR